MDDIELPVFSFRANWREPMLERLSFLTDVLRSTEGAEQRRELRPTPRRSFDADFLLTDNERTFWDLFMDRLGGGEVMAPLYWEVTTVSAALSATVSDRIDFDATLREWQYHEGRLALLAGKTAFGYEVVQIASVDDEGVTLAAPVTRPWPRGTKLYPLRRCVFDQVGEVSQPSAGVANVTAQLRVVGPNPWVPAEDTDPVYQGLPVFLDEPNWVEDLAVSLDREVTLLDLNVGLTYQVDDLGRFLLGQEHRWFLPGRERLAKFKDFIYRHRGRAGAFWLPTFKADLRMAVSESGSSQKIIVEAVGYGYTGGPTSGREYIAIKHDGGTILRRVVSVVPGSSPATERLNLDAPLGLALSPGQVRRISFADTARFDSDDFEITHFGGVDAHHESGARFRTFKNTRSAPSPISFPIPVTAKNTTGCGGFQGFEFIFSPNIPIMLDGDTFNIGTFERGNINLDMRTIGGGGLGITTAVITLSSVARPDNPEFTECWNNEVLIDEGTFGYQYSPSERRLRIRLLNGRAPFGPLRVHVQGRNDLWDGLPWTVEGFYNGAIVEWLSITTGSTMASGWYVGNPDFDDRISTHSGSVHDL